MVQHITLTTNPEQRAKLERKLAEYKARDYRGLLSDLKFLVLKTLLEKGSVDLNELYHPERSLSRRTYEEAFGIIDAYNTGDLIGVHGGTGLR